MLLFVLASVCMIIVGFLFPSYRIPTNVVVSVTLREVAVVGVFVPMYLTIDTHPVLNIRDLHDERLHKLLLADDRLYEYRTRGILRLCLRRKSHTAQPGPFRV